MGATGARRLTEIDYRKNDMKRRDILKAGSGALALASLFNPATSAAAGSGFAWSEAAAKALVGQTFWLNHPERRALALVLTAVHAHPQPQPRLAQFSLEFASTETTIAAASYEFEQAATGLFSLFIQPAAAGAGNTRYRAEFSLLA
jgi:hypothetical protein